MKSTFLQMLAIGAAFAAAVNAQGISRRASIIGGGSPDRGKCTIEVVVDTVAEVEVRGSNATLRTIAGQPAQWRRFECSSPMPNNPPNFRFAGVDGRGRQSLVRDPRNGGAVVVQIEDKDGGSEGYTFDLFWDARGPGYGSSNNAPPPPPPDDRPGAFRPGYRDSDYYRRNHRGFGTDEAIRVCQDEVSRQATRRFRSNDIHFDRTSIDDNPGRMDWVVGTVDVHRGRRGEQYGFSCSVNFDTGAVRSAQLDERPARSYRY